MPAAKTTGLCAPQSAGTCPGLLDDWTPTCQHSVPNGKTSQFNGCGPQGGLDLPVLGRGDWVPDRPLDLANFFDPCKGHDCCYGQCGSVKTECDANFLAGMIRACNEAHPPNSGTFDSLYNANCLSVAAAYYEAVSATETGQKAYNAGQQEVCSCCEDTLTLIYSHSSELSYSGTPEKVAAAPTEGTEMRYERWGLSSTIVLTGDAATGLSGSAPLTFDLASSHLEWDGWFSGQAGPKSCHGSDVTDLTGTAPGTAQVAQLTISSPTEVTLLFDTGQQHGVGGRLPPAPTETYHDVQTYDACQNADNTETGSSWNGYFNYFYSQQEMMSPTYGMVKIDSGWRGGTDDVIATRTVSGTYPWVPASDPVSVSYWIDRYMIVRGSG